MSDTDDPQFKTWLTARMNAANLSKAERAEFLRWLVKRKGESVGSSTKSDAGTKGKRLKELKECFDWLKVRITESDISEIERREFDAWIAIRMREGNLLDDDE
ncbi:hypothetical protein BH11CYA1_BH11CYA1_50520 [soil metagenome]